MTLLRHWLRRRASVRGVGLLVALALVMATMPRWQAHVHEMGSHDHVNAELHAAHHAEAADSAGDADPFESQHAHPIAPVAVALPAIAQLDLAIPLPHAWASPQRGQTMDSPPSGPPHRPPIS